MRPEAEDMARLWDMLDAAKTIAQFMVGKRLEHLLSERMLRNAVERNLEIIGLAASHVSQKTRAAYPDIPWTSIVGLRNVIAHEYGEIRYEMVWNICENRLPELIRRLLDTGVENPPASM